MGLNLVTLLKNMNGIRPKPMVLSSTIRWYSIRIVSSRIEMVFIQNRDEANELRVAIVPTNMNPEHVGRFNTTWGFFKVVPEDFIALPTGFDIWIQPTVSDQSVYTIQFSEDKIEPDDDFGG